MTSIVLTVAMMHIGMISLNSQAVSSTAILEQGLNTELNNLPYLREVDFYKKEKQGLPLIDEINLRTETDEYLLKKQHYQVRFKFNGYNERKAQKALLNAQESEFIVRQKIFLLDFLRIRYEDLIDLYFVEKELELDAKEVLLLEDKRKVFNKLIENEEDFNIKKWIVNEKDIRESTLNKIKNKSISDGLYQFLGYRNVQLDYSDWINIDKIEKLIESISLSPSLPSNLLSKVEEKIANYELLVDKSEAQQWFDFVQVQYKDDDKLFIDKEVSIGASFNIPLKSFNRVKLNEGQIKVLKAEDKAILQKAKRNDLLFRTISNIKRDIKMYQAVKSFIASENVGDTYNTYQKIPNISPLVLLDLKMTILTNKKEVIAIEKNIYRNYIKLLYLSGKMIEYPILNYLHIDNTKLQLLRGF